jgi:hypothetical protein
VVISFGPVNCTPTTLTDTEYVCELDTAAVTSEWIVEVNSQNGLIANSIDEFVTVSSYVTSVSPNTEINYLGGQVLTIVGNNFGYNSSAVSVVFTDGTNCTIQSVDMTSINCETNRWTDGADSDQTLTVLVFGVEDSSLTITLIGSVEESLSITPSSASPVLKIELVIALASDYSKTLYK